MRAGGSKGLDWMALVRCMWGGKHSWQADKEGRLREAASRASRAAHGRLHGGRTSIVIIEIVCYVKIHDLCSTSRTVRGSGHCSRHGGVLEVNARCVLVVKALHSMHGRQCIPRCPDLAAHCPGCSALAPALGLPRDLPQQQAAKPQASWHTHQRPLRQSPHQCLVGPWHPLIAGGGGQGQGATPGGRGRLALAVVCSTGGSGGVSSQQRIVPEGLARLPSPRLAAQRRVLACRHAE